jgi:TM2 domain-containing membrane protein YozV
MPEPTRGRVCARCGQENPVGATRCAECGEALTGAGAVLLTEREGATGGYSGPWWQSETGAVTTTGETETSETAGRSLPLPPQLREERERQLRAQEELARWAEERRRTEDAARAARQVAYEQALRRRERAQERLERRERELAEAEVAALYGGRETVGETEETAAYGTRVGVRAREEEDEILLGGQTYVAPTVQVTPVVEPREEQIAGMTNPVVAALSSLLLPGLGQFMNGQGVKALLLILGFLVATFVFSQSPVGLLVMVGRILSAVDAYRIATRRRAGKPIRDGEWDLG